MLSLSKEQFSASAPGNGVRAVIANAGSGKTTTATELFRRLFRAERDSLFPGTARLSEDQTHQICRLFFLTSFTVKQSADLDRKIKDVLRHEGAPIPQRNGKEIRLCRTLDSHLQSWLSRRTCFRAWCNLEFGWPRDFANLTDFLAPAAREWLRLDKDGEVLDGPDRLLKVFYKCTSILTGESQSILAEGILRMKSGPKLPLQLSPKILVDDFRIYLGTIEPSKEKWTEEFWRGRCDLWKRDRLYFSDLHANLSRHLGAAGDDHRRKALIELASTWKSTAGTAERFLNLYQIAKTRGYNPLSSPHFLASQALLEAFASTEGIEGECIASFHDWAVAYEQLKRNLGLLDFSDWLESYLAVVGGNRWLLEEQKDIPQMGFRFKYCIWDEAQDFTPRQMRLVKLMAPKQGRPGMTLVVGDGKQSLYLFAGSSPYEFTKWVKEMRATGQEVFTLSTSFRSARRIVELGNEVANKLPSYAKSVTPSQPVYDEEGQIEVSPPLLGEEDEAIWILKRIDSLLRAGESSIMVVFRNDPSPHPLSYMLREEKYKAVEVLTIHRAKGLEAKHVFIGGCTAGRFPIPVGDSVGKPFEEKLIDAAAADRRLFNDQECNAVYVAVTRAAWSVTFSIPTMLRVKSANGETRDERTGPSPIFWELPTLRDICLRSGWSEESLRAGVAAHEKKVDTFYQRFHGRIWALNEEAKKLGLKPGSADSGEAKDREDVSSLGVHPLLLEKSSKRVFAKGSVASSVVKVGLAVDVVRKKCAASFFNAKPPSKLNSDERDLAFKEGWIELADSGKLQFSAAFKAQFRPT